ncbi:hypothetical protein SpCBS45565_g07813 [Spizellomyces sp. 'palustris']|nr:hypothetical protein SpCBS45565_g07813 [Spizellomyces sp. 'palustris']
MTTRPSQDDFGERPAKRRFSVDIPDTFSHFTTPQSTPALDAYDEDPFKDFTDDSYGMITEGETSDDGQKDQSRKRPSIDEGDLPKSDTYNGNMANGSAPPKKRSRATPEQLAILEETFLTNTSPNAKLREILATKVNMTERSIQIWFQNRRAKVKLMQKRAAQQAAQEQAMRTQTYLAAAYGMRPPFYPTFSMPYGAYGQMPPKMPPIGRSNSVDFALGMGMGVGMNMGMGMGMGVPNGVPPPGMVSVNGGKAMSLQNGSPAPPPPSNNLERVTMPFTAESLAIGTWRRVPITTNDLICTFNTMERVMRWQIVEGTSKFKMEFPFASIAAISFDQLDAFTGQVTIDLNQCPMFFMEMSINGGSVWTQCRDFTENTQATCVLRHVIKGQLQALRGELLLICQSDVHVHRATQMNAPAGGGPMGNMGNMGTGIVPLSAAAASSAAASMPQFARRHSTPNLIANNQRKRQNSFHEPLRRRPTVVTSMNTPSGLTRMNGSPILDSASLSGSPRMSTTSGDMITPPVTPPPSLATLSRRHSLLSSPAHSEDSLNINTNPQQAVFQTPSPPELLSDLSYISISGGHDGDPTSSQQSFSYTGPFVESFMDTLTGEMNGVNNGGAGGNMVTV